MGLVFLVSVNKKTFFMVKVSAYKQTNLPFCLFICFAFYQFLKCSGIWNRSEFYMVCCNIFEYREFFFFFKYSKLLHDCSIPQPYIFQFKEIIFHKSLIKTFSLTDLWLTPCFFFSFQKVVLETKMIFFPVFPTRNDNTVPLKAALRKRVADYKT